MLNVELRAYQETGLEKFLTRGNLLLTMDMGSGKTVTAIGAAEQLLGDGQVTTVLICCPATLISQWAQALAAATDVETRRVKAAGRKLIYPTEDWCLIIHGTPERRARLLAKAKASPPQYIIASYDTVAASTRAFKALAQFVVIDEATVIKSLRAARAKLLRTLCVPWRLALTGTPVETGRPEEAWAIMNWVDPELFGPWRDFEDAYIRRNRSGIPIRYVNLATMHRKLSSASFRVRRTDPEVAPYMPEVERVRWSAEMDPATAEVYTRIMADLMAEMEASGERGNFDPAAYYAGFDEGSGPGKTMAIHQAAMMLLDHPDLIRESAAAYEQGKGGSAYAARIVTDGYLVGLTATPKLTLLKKCLDPVFSVNLNKVIVVTRHVAMLSRVAQMFEGVPHVLYHGDMSVTQRASAVDRFEHDESVRLLVMSHAGAYGLDLPRATHLVVIHPPRSAGQGEQIEARHVRASSTHASVQVAILLVAGTVEERAHDHLDHNREIAAAIVDGSNPDGSGVIHNSVTSLTSHARAVTTLNRS